MKKEFVPYAEALALKELGFDEKCGACYYKKFDNEIGYHKVYRDFNFVQLTVSAPTFSQAFRWFREVYNIYVEISFNQKYENPRFGYIVRTKSTCLHTRDFPYKTYEEAELECLKKIMEIVKDGRN